MKFHTRDWLDNKELRRCSPAARSVLTDLMCLAHEGYPYGHLSDKLGPLTEDYMASRCVVSVGKFRTSVEELKTAFRLSVSASGVLFVERMVEDEDLRLRRAAGGSLGGNPNLSNKVNHVVKVDSRERARRASGSGSGSDNSDLPEEEKTENGSIFPSPAKIAEESFENQFWPNYWRKVSRKPALEVWLRATEGKPELAEVIIGAMLRQTGEMMSREPSKRPHASTWLNQRRWEDEPSQPATPPKTKLQELFDSI